MGVRQTSVLTPLALGFFRGLITFRFFLVFSFLILSPLPAFADFYFEQEVSRSSKNVDTFKRKVFILDSLLAIQIEKGQTLLAEYGFDFKKRIYYEALPASDKYTLYSLDSLAEGFNKLTVGAPSGTSRRNMAGELSRAVQEGKANYDIRVRKAIFGAKTLLNRQAKPYQLKAGPGSTFLNPFGWYLKGRLWATKDIPGYPKYQAMLSKLRQVSDFYKIKSNRVSHFILAASRLDGFILEAEYSSKRYLEGDTVKEESRESVVFIGTQVIDTKKLLYYEDASRFKWHVVFSEGTDFGPDVTLTRGSGVNARAVLPWFIVPVAYLIAAYAWFLSGIADESWLSLRRFVTEKIHLLALILLFFQIIHFAANIPYAFSPAIELSVIFLLGASWIVWRSVIHARRMKSQMDEECLHKCPHCKAIIETFYVECPRCNRPIAPGGEHSSL